MKSDNAREICCGCHACYSACPTNCIKMVVDAEGFLYPKTNECLCHDCGRCKSVCPMLVAKPHGEQPSAFAAWNRNKTVRTQSSSGGVFSALMQYVFEDGGFVLGAAFDDSLTLRHQTASCEKDGAKFRGSKYLQSAIGDSYTTVQRLLGRGEKVFFSGTPCQVAGLYSFLGGDSENLLTADLVCHGVPSGKVFAAYRAFVERQHNTRAKSVSFRAKNNGWKRYSMAIFFEDETKYCRQIHEDPFMLGFLKNLYLRPSCHACRFSRFPRVADISLGDFWGVEKHHPEWDDDMGTSLVLIQNEKGMRALEACKRVLAIHQADLSVAIKSNPCISGSAKLHKNRKLFFSDLDTLPFEKLVKKYMTPPNLFHKTVKQVKRVVKYGLNKM